MADPKSVFLGVPSGEVRVEAPDQTLFTRGFSVEARLYDGQSPRPGPLLPGDFDNVRELYDKD